MPNLEPPVRRSEDAARYRDAILAAVPPDQAFKPLMTLYLTETTEPEDLRQGWEAGIVTAVKLYPAGATTNSDAGVRDLKKFDPVFETMAELGMPLLIHGEVVDPEIDIFDREAVFIERELKPCASAMQGLRWCLSTSPRRKPWPTWKAKDRTLRQPSRPIIFG